MELKPGYKQTEVGVIPEDWDVKLVADVLRFRSGKAHEQFISDTGTYVCVNSKFISTDGRIRKYSKENFSPAKKGDILMVMSDIPNGQALASAYFVEVDNIYAVNQRICALTAYRDLPKYLFYILDRNPYFLGFDNGVSQTNLLNNVFQKCPIPIPATVSEQRSIATVLSGVDAILAELEKLIAKKRAIKQAAMQELLTGKRRLPEFEGEWEVKRLDEVATLSKGDQLHSSEAEEGGKFAHLNGGITPSGYTNKSNTPANSIAISEGGNSCGYVQFMTEPYWCGGHCYSVYPKGIDKVFLYHALKGQQTAIMGLRVGSGLPNVQKASLLSFKLRFPGTVSEQTAIASVLTEMDAELTALDQWREKSRAIKQALMQELLTGRTRLV